jgi:hypothetical protein
MKKCVEQSKVLIVSDSPDRYEFLHYHIKRHYLSPIWYPNILSARKAVISMPFFMVVVDLSLPIESKLTLIREVCHYQPDAQVITIEKTRYLKKTGVLSSFPSVVSIDSISWFQDKLEAYSRDGSCYRNVEPKMIYLPSQSLH